MGSLVFHPDCIRKIRILFSRVSNACKMKTNKKMDFYFQFHFVMTIRSYVVSLQMFRFQCIFFRLFAKE